MNYFTMETDARTGDVRRVEWSPDRIAMAQAKEASAKPKVPVFITPRQCRLILSQQGLLASVEEVIAGMDEPTRITWEYALEFRRDDPLLNQLAVSLNLTSEQIDQFFIAAAQL